ncbi:uncharacterized protein GLRG_02609 [Colletotrichum graminicola M1.001]|uniref:Uncharacterized protein n=1 Tax=Colletotrichum graminicola (strain M1.001 / M2 / FGSC 10212) TaxID=645133 RepID=E3Q7F1_COLGM|nr:uncharacterized protein GLRG_02609 [Colletotrichum graminicola M1.001]EFQ26789.1 hypothetical protein GLRG_02609 [Colletotrichum graminicola M1.001]
MPLLRQSQAARPDIELVQVGFPDYSECHTVIDVFSRPPRGTFRGPTQDERRTGALQKPHLVPGHIGGVAQRHGSRAQPEPVVVRGVQASVPEIPPDILVDAGRQDSWEKPFGQLPHALQIVRKAIASGTALKSLVEQRRRHGVPETFLRIFKELDVSSLDQVPHRPPLRRA